MPHKKNDWEFLLTGAAQTLSGLSSLCHCPHFFLFEELDHMNDCQVDDFRLKSSFCDDANDYQLVWQVGYELVSLFNGASCLKEHSATKIQIDHLWLEGRHTSRYEDLEIFGLLGKPDITGEEWNQAVDESKVDFRIHALTAATESQEIYLILKYFDMQPSWVVYYKLLETIEVLAKKEGIALGIDKNAKKSFTNSANHYSIVGLAARHGFKEQARANNTSAMPFNESHTFIREIAKQYLAAKI